MASVQRVWGWRWVVLHIRVVPYKCQETILGRPAI
jgi:hypothetical protein